MTRRHPVVRFLLASVAAVQLAAPVLAALADAAYARDAEWIGIHIEGKRGPNDHWPHHDDCTFCQFLAQHAVATHGYAEPRARLVASLHIATPRSYLPRVAVSLLPDSRAPPPA